MRILCYSRSHKFIQGTFDMKLIQHMKIKMRAEAKF